MTASRAVTRATAESPLVRRALVTVALGFLLLTLVLPLRYAMGFMLGGRYLSLYGPDTVKAFGHLGFTNIIAWADPERQVAGALMTSGKPVIYPELVYLFDVMRQIDSACPKTKARHRTVRSLAVARRRAGERRAGAARR